MARIHTFDSWNQELNEGLFSSFKNALSRFFGGAVSKIDKVLKDYKDNADDYWERWADARNKIASAEAMLAGIRKDPLQREQYREQLERANKLMAQVDSTKDKVESSLTKQGSILTAGSDRLKDYWEYEKAKTDYEIARDAYDRVKHITDDKDIEKMYSELEKKMEIAKEKEQAFTENHAHIDSMNSWMRQEHEDSKIPQGVSPAIAKAAEQVLDKPEAKPVEAEKKIDAPKPDAPKTPEVNVDTFLTNMRGAMEMEAGVEKLDNGQFEKLKADMIKIYRKSISHSTETPHDLLLKLSQWGAEFLLVDKDKNKQLDKNLSDSEIDAAAKKFDEYCK